jgi:hypothetical protein
LNQKRILKRTISATFEWLLRFGSAPVVAFVLVVSKALAEPPAPANTGNQGTSLPIFDPSVIKQVGVVGVGVFVALLLFYVIAAMFKSRIAGFRGDYMRVVDTIAISQSTRLCLVEIYQGDLYLVSCANDRVTLVDKITTPSVVEKVRYPRGRPERVAS